MSWAKKIVWRYQGVLEPLLGTLNHLPIGETKIRIGCAHLYAESVDRLFAAWAWKLGILEKAELALISRIIRPGMIVADVGANIGLYTMRASRLVGSQGKVIAIEAEPSNYEALVFNLKLNQTNNVIPLNLAAWDKEAMLDLHIFQEHALHSLTPSARESAKSIKVKARPLDKVLQELGIEKVDWIKIDVEGAEVEVLQGMEKTISRNPELKLLVELHSGETTEKCLSLLKGKGYEVRQIDHNHIFALPKEKIDIVARLEDEYA